MMQLLFLMLTIIVGTCTNINAVRVTVTGRGGKTETITIPYNQQVTPGTTVGGAVLSPADTSSTVNINFGRGGGQSAQQQNQQLVPAPQGLVRPTGQLPQPPMPQVPAALPNIQLPQIPGPLVGPVKQISDDKEVEMSKLQQGGAGEDLEKLSLLGEEERIVINIQQLLNDCVSGTEGHDQPDNVDDVFPRVRFLKNGGFRKPYYRPKSTSFNLNDYLGQVYKNNETEKDAIDKNKEPQAWEYYRVGGNINDKTSKIPQYKTFDEYKVLLYKRIEAICKYIGRKYGKYPDAYEKLKQVVNAFVEKLERDRHGIRIGSPTNNNNDNDNNNNNSNLPSTTTTTTIYKPQPPINQPSPQQQPNPQQQQQGNYPQSLLNQMPALPNDLRLLPVVEGKPYDSFPGAVDPIKRRVPRNMIPWYNILSVDRNTGNFQDVNRNYSTLRAQIDQKINETDRKNFRMLHTLDSMINILNAAHTIGVQYFQRKK